MSTNSIIQSGRTQSSTKYEKLALRIEKRIRNGEYRPGEALPAIRQLMKSSQMGNATVVKSMTLLERRGLVNRHPQRGYFVADLQVRDTQLSHIALVTPNLTADTDLIASGVRDILSHDKDYSLSVYSTNSNFEIFQKTIRQMSRIRPAGIMLGSMASDVYQIDASPIAEAGIPTVVMGQRVEGFIRDRVDYRGRESAMKLGRYLLERGARDFAFLTVDLPHDPSRIEFIETFRRMLSERGLSLPEDRIYRFSAPHGFSSKPDPIIDAQECMRQVLARANRPETLICCHDYTAFGAIRAILAAGLSVPHDIQVASIATTVGVNAIPMRLTTVNVHHEEWGRVAGELLLKRMQGYDGEYEVHYIAGNLAVGDTTK